MKRILPGIIIVVLVTAAMVLYGPWHQRTPITVPQPPPPVLDGARAAFPSAADNAPNVVREEQTIATAGKTSSSSLPAVCTGSEFDIFRCYQTYYDDLVKRSGVRAATADLRNRYGAPFIKAQCHQLSHIIGRAAVSLYPVVADAYREGDSFCWSGYYHGVMEAIVAGESPEQVVARIDGICSGIPGKDRYSFDYYNCVHGLGHGLMAISQNELPQSLEACDRLTGGWEQSSCWSGAFMENVMVDERNHFTKYLKADDPLYPCDGVGDRYKSTCYLMQTSRMLKMVGYNFTKVFELCRTVEAPYVDICFQSLGRDASGQSVSDVERTSSICRLGRDARERQHCITGAAKDFISYLHSDTRARELCATNPEWEASCLATVEGYYRLF